MKRSFWIGVRVFGIVLAPILAAAITLGLFYFMQSLIASGERLEQRVVVVKLVDPTMPEIEMVVIEEIDKPEPIEAVIEQDVELDEKRVDLDAGPSLNIERVVADMDMGLNLSMASITQADGDYLPLVAIPAQYPGRASARGIEGWCILSFTVNSQGNVVEDSIAVVDAEPPGVFERASRQALVRFKFQPRVRDGVAVDVPGVQYLFTFELED